MLSRRKQDDIPIKIGGWDGKFVYEKPKLKEGYELVKPTRGALEKQQWQEGRKEVVNKAKNHFEETTSKINTTTTSSTSSNTSTQSKEHYTRVKTREDQHHDECYNQNEYEENKYVENRQENQSNYDSYQQQEQHHQQQEKYQEQQQQRYNPPNPHQQQYLNEREYNQCKQTTSDGNQLHGYNTETEVLPGQWDGKYPVGYRNYRPKPDQNRSNAGNLYGFDKTPTVLPVQWDGKFAKSGDTYLLPERNQSKTNDYYGYDNRPTVLPTTWNGQFQLDSNDVRIKPERNASDVRDYADHRRFVTRE